MLLERAILVVNVRYVRKFHQMVEVMYGKAKTVFFGLRCQIIETQGG